MELSNIEIGDDTKDTTNMHPARGKAEGRGCVTGSSDDIGEDPTENEISERHHDANNEDSIVNQSSDDPATHRETTPTFLPDLAPTTQTALAGSTWDRSLRSWMTFFILKSLLKMQTFVSCTTRMLAI